MNKLFNHPCQVWLALVRKNLIGKYLTLGLIVLFDSPSQLDRGVDMIKGLTDLPVNK